MTLYEALMEAGVECTNYQSDLYFPRTETAKKVLKEFPNVYPSTFTHNVTKEPMYEVPLAFDPYWQANDE